MNKTKESIIKQLDDVLDYFKTPFEQGGLSFDNIAKYFDPETKNNFGHQLVAILEKLERDKLITKNHVSRYHISIEGKLFEGYMQQHIDNEKEKEYKFNFDKRLSQSADRLNLGTWFLGAVTALLLLWELLKFYLEHHFCWCCLL